MADKLLVLLNGEDKNNSNNEPLLKKQLSDFIPDESNKMHKDFKEIYYKMMSFFWIPGEIKLYDDQIHMKSRLNKKEINAIKFVVAFFANADSIVAENIKFNLGAEVQPFYCKAGYDFIVAMENIHSMTYDIIMNALFPIEIADLKKNIVNIPAIRAKMNFMAKWMSADCTFHERVIAFLCVEGIFFSSSFAIIFWFKTRGLLPGTVQANELILRDEGFHQDFAILIHKYVVEKSAESRVWEIIKEAVTIESEFIDAALPESVEDLSAERLKFYVQYLADRMAGQLNYNIIYKTANPCNYMVRLGIETKANFFEVAGTNYLVPSSDKTLKSVKTW